GRSAQVGHGHDMDHYAADAAAVVAHPGQTATEFTGHVGQGVEEGAEAAVRIAVLGPDTPTGTVTDRAGVLPW
ncbi:alpha/beta hydrolase, partial [Streptomyces heliomycini]